jgi:hypothetical protein
MKLLIANVIESAFHNAAERSNPPRCHPRTRSAIRTEIMDWIKNQEAGRKLILWLYGPAGGGKTAIGQSIAEECEKQGLLGASFFFDRTAAGRNTMGRFIATLAYQLTLSIPQIRETILAAIERDPTIFSRQLLVQMQTLVITPLMSFEGLGQPWFVVVDGVDEIGPTGQPQAELLHVVGTAVSELKHIPIIFLIISRPEYDIRMAFNADPLHSLMEELSLDERYEPDADIKLYLTDKFQEIRSKELALGTNLHSSWPSDSDLDRLVAKSSGQFIYAATVMKFIDSRRDPSERLKIILGLTDPGKETPFAALDALYRFILSSVDDLPRVLDVLRLLILGGDYNYGLQVGVIEELLGFEVRRTLMDMHALVFVPSPSDPESILHTHHASLADFLMDESRSLGFFINSKQGHIALGRCWLGMIKDYYNPICFRPRSSSLKLAIECFISHSKKAPEIADDLAKFNLEKLMKQIRDANDLYGSDWSNFLQCAWRRVGVTISFNNWRTQHFTILGKN